MLVAAITFAHAQTMEELERDGNGGSNNPAIRRHVSPGASVWTFALMED